MSESDRFERIDQVFREAIERPADERQAFVENACADDPDLLREVLDLLEEDATEGVLDASPILSGDAARTDVPDQIGKYRILRVVGEGGMGIVYEAEQPTPHRVVALKVIRSGFPTENAIRRFEHESELLGRLRHPGIAQVYEAGIDAAGSGEGRPYFAMELVRGVSLTKYALDNNLSTRARLELMERVCDGVHHAHQKGVIHRDLKPANILVDEEGQPKILDFGVARAVDSDISATKQATRTGQLVGTVQYMSPEQATGDPRDIDTRSDVYSLGVVLFELLSGRLPHAPDTESLFEVLKSIREEDPTRIGSIDRRFRGEIETIIGKALAKERGRRYQSAAELGADIRRYLNDEPLVARPTTTAYQLRKFAKRNKLLVGATCALSVSLVAGLAGMAHQRAQAIDARDDATAARELAEENEEAAIQARDDATAAQQLAEQNEQLAINARDEATEARKIAERNERITREVNNFFHNSVLAAASPERGGDTITVREVVDEAAVGIDDNFQDAPDVKSAILSTLGNLYWSFGAYDEAEDLLLRALDAFMANAGPDDPLTIYARSDLGSFYSEITRFDEAEKHLRDALADRQRVLGEHHADTLKTQRRLGSVLQGLGRFDESLETLEGAYELAMQHHGPDETVTWLCADPLATYYAEVGRFQEAEELYNAILAFYDREGTRRTFKATTTENNLGVLYEKMGNYEAALRHYQNALSVGEEMLGPEHPDLLPTMFNTALIYRHTGQLEEAEHLYRKTLDLCRKILAPDHFGTMRTMSALGSLYIEMGRLDDAEPLVVEALERVEQSAGPNHPDTLEAMTDLAILRMAQEQYETAGDLWRRSEQGFQQFGDRAAGPIARAKSRQGECFLERNMPAEAKPLLLDAYGRLAALSSGASEQRRCARLLVEIFQAEGDDESAVQWAERAKGVDEAP